MSIKVFFWWCTFFFHLKFLLCLCQSSLQYVPQHVLRTSLYLLLLIRIISQLIDIDIRQEDPWLEANAEFVIVFMISFFCCSLKWRNVCVGTNAGWNAIEHCWLGTYDWVSAFWVDCLSLAPFCCGNSLVEMIFFSGELI